MHSPRPGTVDVESATLRYLLYVLLPAWFLPGLLDWRMHRRTDIQHTSGTRESVLHLAMIAEVGAPLLMALLLEINPAMLALMGGAALTHEATAMWDVRLAAHSAREVRPSEQNIHSFLESMPFIAIGAVACLHPRQVRALVRPVSRESWRLRRKSPPLPRRYVVGVLSAVGSLGVLPYFEELYRCLRAGRDR
ncbi:hypothetical protein [Rugosimonospora africana]|uniref:Diguanylate cyclase n=1 Tax=Rugosimonospora africana TaxID=556532 RepID=A0A8J3VQH1_9ACTN|nr:hypothetical protein [Rugosimonospora africana]GIH14471.1 hypothetical protein Raf01_26430 [Rugosimonospora africana]